MKKISFLIVLLAAILGLAMALTNGNSFTLTSPAFKNKATLPIQYTCDGQNISPPLNWTNIPSTAVALTLILSDTDAPGGTFYHWVLFDVPTTATLFAEGMLTPPIGTIIGMNDWQKAEYNGPCPPKGSLHNYTFTLYALDAALTLPTTASARDVLDAMETHVIATAELTATYSRQTN